MKKKCLVGLLAIACTLTSGVALSACSFGGMQSNQAQNSVNTGNTTNEIQQVYEQYVVYAQAEGQTPLSYENWLVSIKGEKGDTGAQGPQGEQGVSIVKVEYDANGNLVIYFDNDTTQTVNMPDQHVHTYGEWTEFTDEETSCQDKLYLRVCSSCNDVEMKKGTSADHSWTADYVYDGSFHWIDCDYCSEKQDRQEHTFETSVFCPVCDAPMPDSEGIIYQESMDGTYAEVLGYYRPYFEEETKVKIADTYNGLPVKVICQEAFYKKTKIESVIIPDGVTSIGERAFQYCSSLTSITIPNSVTSIGESAFQYCSSLTSVTIGNNVTSIGASAFASCSSLASITIPNSVTNIGEYAFSSCSSLASVTIGNSVTNIGDRAFWGCTNLTSVTLGYNIKHIGASAFAGCTNLASITIPDSVISIGELAFTDCTSLTSIAFEGTIEQWNTIAKESGWNENIPATKVVCYDGNVTL